MSRKQANVVPKKRHLPLKRYRLRADSPVGPVFLIVRARSKKNARFLATQDYVITKARIIEVLGPCKEETKP